MSPDLFFLLTLIVKMAITAGFVVAATVTAERVGPLLAGLVATLPIGAGPVYVFLALDHDAHFIAQGALASLVINAVNAIFAVTYARLAQTQSRAVSMSVAFLTWLVLAVAVHSTDWNFTAAAIVNVAVFSVCLVLVRPLRHVRVKGFRPRWTDLALRAGLVALLVGVVVTFSFQLGPAGSGLLAVFPVVLLSTAGSSGRRGRGRCRRRSGCPARSATSRRRSWRARSGCRDAGAKTRCCSAVESRA